MEISPEKSDNEILKDENGEKKSPEKTMTPKKIKILISVACGNLFLGSCYALMAPIFPAEAEKKNASPTAYGFVFGIYQLAMFLSSPVYGKIIPILKPGFMMKAGMLVSGVCNILFGFLDYAPPGPSFIWLAIVIRFFDALGASAFITASYTTLGCELPDIIGRAMSLTETAFALGLAGGPVIGGLFYVLGGFQLPFTVIGALLILGTGVNFFLFSEDDNDVAPQSISALKLLSHTDFLIDVLFISSCFALIGFNEVSLEPHIRQFNLSPVIVGVIFLVAGITDAVFSLAWGYFAEKVSNAQYLTFLGSLLYITCFLIVGPVSFLHFPTTLWVVVFSQFLLGLGMASEIVCSLTHGMKDTVERGFPNEVGTYSVVSGILFSAACFGAFIGPSVGGYLIDEIGYIGATEAAVGMKVFVASICAGRLLYLHFKKKSNLEHRNII